MEEIERPSFWVHPSLSFVLQGLIDPELRDDNWRIKFSDYLARKITNETFDIEINNETVTISLDSNSEGYIAAYGRLFDESLCRYSSYASTKCKYAN